MAGLEGPLAIVMKKVDAIELLSTLDPFSEPIFVSDVVPDLRMNSALRLWYRLLNCGLKIPATAGTDKMTNRVTVGANRVYVLIKGSLVKVFGLLQGLISLTRQTHVME